METFPTITTTAFDTSVLPLGIVPTAKPKSLVESLALKVANQPSERKQAFQLCHDVYCKSGLTGANPSGFRVMRHHLADTTNVLIATFEDEVVFTVTLVGDGEYGLPMDSLFKDEVDAMRAQGIRTAEISCLASRMDSVDKRVRFDMLVSMVSLLFQTARRRGVQRMLLAVHPRHAKVYERLFGCVPCSEVKSYAAVKGNPAIMCMHDFAAMDEKKYPLYERIYGPRYSPWQLDGAKMHESEKMFYAQHVPAGEYQIMPVAA